RRLARFDLSRRPRIAGVAASLRGAARSTASDQARQLLRRRDGETAFPQRRRDLGEVGVQVVDDGRRGDVLLVEEAELRHRVARARPLAEEQVGGAPAAAALVSRLAVDEARPRRRLRARDGRDRLAVARDVAGPVAAQREAVVLDAEAVDGALLGRLLGAIGDGRSQVDDHLDLVLREDLLDQPRIDLAAAEELAGDDGRESPRDEVVLDAAVL